MASKGVIYKIPESFYLVYDEDDNQLIPFTYDGYIIKSEYRNDNEQDIDFRDELLNDLKKGIVIHIGEV